MAGRFSTLIVCLLLILWGSLGSANFNKTPDDYRLHILSYNEMLKLPVETRAKYIEQIRRFMVQEEKAYPLNWDAFTHSSRKTSSLVPGIDDVLWSTAEGADLDGAGIAVHADSDDFDVAIHFHDLFAYFKKMATTAVAASAMIVGLPDIVALKAAQMGAQMGAALRGNHPSAAQNPAGPNPVDTAPEPGSADLEQQTGNPAAEATAGANRIDPTLHPSVSQAAIVAVKATEKASCKKGPCYFAGNESKRTDCVCHASDILDKTDTKICNKGSDIINSVACNRKLYGVQASGTPFCVPRAQNATAKCEEIGMSAKDVAINFKSMMSDPAWKKFAGTLQNYCLKHQSADCTRLTNRLNVLMANASSTSQAEKVVCSFKDKDHGQTREIFLRASPLDAKSAMGSDLSKMNLSLGATPTTAEQDIKCGSDKECYKINQFEKVDDIGLSGVDSHNSVTLDMGNGNKLKLSPDASHPGHCDNEFLPATAQAPDVHPPHSEGPCQGSVYCSVQQIQQECHQSDSNFQVKVNSHTGCITVAHPMHTSDGKSAMDKGQKDCVTDTNLDRTLNGIIQSHHKEGADGQVVDDGRDWADLVLWGKGAAEAEKGKPAKIFGDVDPHNVAEYLGDVGVNDAFKRAVLDSPAFSTDNCPGQNWKLIGPVGADDLKSVRGTITLACGDLKDGKDSAGVTTLANLRNRAYVKINVIDDNGAPHVNTVETGIMDHAGRPKSSEVFRDGEAAPYLIISHKHGLGSLGIYQYIYNVQETGCPDRKMASTYPFTAVFKKNDGSFAACQSEVPAGSYQQWHLYMGLTSNSDGSLEGRSDDSQQGKMAMFKFSVNPDSHGSGTPMCLVSKDDKPEPYLSPLPLSDIPGQEGQVQQVR